MAALPSFLIKERKNMNTTMKSTKEENLEYIQKRVDEIIKKHCGANDEGDIKIYTDYESSRLSDRGLATLSNSDSPRECFREMLVEWETETDCSYSECFNAIKHEFSNEELSLYYAWKDEVDEYIFENYHFYYDEEDFTSQKVNVNIQMDVGNCNYDFTCDNVLNYYSNMYGTEEENEVLFKESSILWLAKQQAQEKILENAVRYLLEKDEDEESEKEPDTTPFVGSCISELRNLPSHMGTLTFLVKMKLSEFFDLRDAMHKEEKKNESYVLEKRTGTGYVILDKGVMCGLFDSWNGGGSVMGIKPEKDVEIPFRCIHRAEIDTGKSLYGYSVNDVYGLMDSAWKEGIKKIVAEET